MSEKKRAFSPDPVENVKRLKLYDLQWISPHPIFQIHTFLNFSAYKLVYAHVLVASSLYGIAVVIHLTEK
jgi:hypothetical protein